MGVIGVLLIAISLSFDSFAVSVSTGLAVNGIRFLQAIRIAFVLAFFQGLMPLVGWFAGKEMSQFISKYDHWVAFSLLSIIGVLMIIQSFKDEEQKSKSNPLKFIVAIGMGIATSIDALIVGVSFAFVEIQILLAVIIIGIITFFASMLGMLFGKKIGGKFGNKMEIIGGIILFVIGLKIIISNLIVN